jgi:general secretion pathway protein A
MATLAAATGAAIAIAIAAGSAMYQPAPSPDANIARKAPTAGPINSTGKSPPSAASVAAAVPGTASAAPAPSAPNQPSTDANDWNPVAIAGADAGSADLQLAQLAKLWQLTPENAGSLCREGAKGALRCYKSAGGLAEIRQLNRPVLLTLRDDNDQTYYALLTGLTNVDASLRIGDTSRTVSLVTLARRWRGGFATFWRAPPGYRKELVLGDSGTEVDWLARQLATLSGAKEPPAGRQFELTMRQQVREFQLAQGLVGDGVAGPRTFMLLNSAAGVNEPRLQNNSHLASAAPGK